MTKFSIGTQKRIKIHDADLRSAYFSEKTSVTPQNKIVTYGKFTAN